MKLQVSVNTFQALLVLQADGATPPAGCTKLTGTFDHPEPTDDLGWIGNHVVQQHVRDVCYHNGIQDMGRYVLIDMVGKDVDENWRDFFIVIGEDGSLVRYTGTPAVGTTIMDFDQTEPGRVTMVLEKDLEDRIKASTLFVNSKPCELLTATFDMGVTTCTFAIPKLHLRPGQANYFRFRYK